MTHRTSLISPKTAGIVAALVVPMLLIPASAHAKSSHRDWNFLNQPIKVKQGDFRADRDHKFGNREFGRFFDGSVPRDNRATNRARNKTMKRSRKNHRNRSRRHGNQGDYYQDEFAASCVSPRQIHRRLKRQGWRNFHKLRIRPTVLRFKARQTHQGHQGRDLTYNLKIDRCTGALMKVQLQRRDMWYLRWMRRLSAAF